MSAALRVSWTFFTALPLQRWLGGIGAALAGLLAAAGLVVQQPLWIAGVLVLFVFAAFPALFASAAVFRALSAPRANRLLPHFRVRMLGAVALFMAALLAFLAPFFLLPAAAPNRAAPIDVLVYAFVFATAMFLLMFLQCGNWRWMWLWLGFSVGLSALVLSPWGAAVAIPASAWLVAALAAWAVFALWYVRAHRIAPVALVPQPAAGAWSRVNLDGPVARESALRAIVTGRPPGARTPLLLVAIGLALAVLAIAASVTPVARFLPFTSVAWPFSTMMVLWGKATSIVHRSRLLWLPLPGNRDAVRREIERTLLRSLGGATLLLLGAAALYGSPLLAVPPREVLAGLALAVAAGLFGAYAALAAVPGNPVQLVTFALLITAQVGLLARPSPALADVVAVTALELIGALAFRAFAIRRWRHIDWLRVRPLSPSSMLRWP